MITDLPFERALYKFSNTLGEYVVICGHTSIPDELKDMVSDDDEPVEASAVLVNLETGAIEKSDWLEGIKDLRPRSPGGSRRR